MANENLISNFNSFQIKDLTERYVIVDGLKALVDVEALDVIDDSYRQHVYDLLFRLGADDIPDGLQWCNDTTNCSKRSKANVGHDYYCPNHL